MRSSGGIHRWRGLAVGLALVGLTACASSGPARAAAEAEDASVFNADGANIAGKFLAGRHAESVGNYAAAVDLTRDVLEAMPADEKLMTRTHFLLVSVGRFADAVPLARRIVVDDPDDAAANMTLTVDALARADFATALTYLEKQPASGPNRILLPLLRGWTLAGNGDTAAALEELGRFEASGTFAVIASLHAGMVAELSGDDVAAGEAYQRTADATENGEPLQLVRAYSHFLARTGRAEEARTLAADFAKRHPTNMLIDPTQKALAAGTVPDAVAPTAQAGAAQSLRAVADLLHREGANDHALVYIRLALHLDPGDPAMLSLLGAALRGKERFDEAIAVYESIDAASPYHWYAELDTANTLQAMDEIDRAILLLESMVDERPERADAPRALGDFLRFEDRYAEAVDAYDMAIERTAGDPDWRLFYSRGIAYERQNNWPPAEADFLRALELEPEQPLVLNYLGYSWVELGMHLDKARAMIEKAVQQRPRDGYITDSLGWVLYRLGEYEDAVAWLEKAVSLAPGDATINDHLGDAYWLVDRRQEARFQWHRALSLDPEPDMVEKIRAKIDGKEQPKPLPPGERRDI